MNTKLKNLYESVRQSLWLVPALSIFLALLLSFFMAFLEKDWAKGWSDLPFIYTSGSEASLAVLGTITSSLITVAGVTFSITIVSLTLASSQFGPRLLRNFLRSFPSQLTLGALIGSFVYGILVMPGIDSEWQSGQAHPSISLMIVLAIVCVCLLVYYIHHVATSIQADTLIAAVYRELEQKIDALPDRKVVIDQAGEEISWDGETTRLSSWRSGYVTAIDGKSLLSWAMERGTALNIKKHPGQFIVRGELLAEAEGTVDGDALEEALREDLYIQAKRTPEQDLEFLISQLVEVALRAISPGINDPNTAITCIDYVAAALGQLSGKELPAPLLRGKDGIDRVFCPQSSFGDLTANAFDQLRYCGCDYPEIVVQLLDSLTRIASFLEGGDARLKPLRHQLEKLAELVDCDCETRAKDADGLDAAFKRCRSALSD